MVVDQPRTATRAVLSLAVDVARWFDPRGRETAAEVGRIYADLAVRMLGAAPPPTDRPREDHPVTTEERPAGRTPAGPMDVTGLPPELERREPAEILAGLLAVMDLRALEPDAAGQDMFEGDSQWQPHGRVYGGQVLGQTLMAASLTVDAGRPVHSMHGYFLRPGDATQPIQFAVERLRDGRSFTARRVHALQDGRPILSMIASFQDADEGYDHQDAMPDVPGPDELPTTAELLGHIDHPAAQYWSYARPIDVRHVQSPIYVQADSERRASQAVWMRTVAPMPDDPVLHRAVLGYASDYTLLESVLRRHGALLGDGRARRRASTTRCGGTAPPAPTSGCSTPRPARPPRAAAASAPAGSSPRTASWSPPSPRRAWSARRGRGRRRHRCGQLRAAHGVLDQVRRRRSARSCAHAPRVRQTRRRASGRLTREVSRG